MVVLSERERKESKVGRQKKGIAKVEDFLFQLSPMAELTLQHNRYSLSKILDPPLHIYNEIHMLK